MFSFQSPRSLTILAVALALGTLGVLVRPAWADGPTGGGVVIDVNGPTRGRYPIAIPTAVDGDAGASKQVAEVMSFDLSVAGVFKVIDPQSFLADLKSEALGIDPQK
jgi:hypothetical protein